MKKLLLTLLLTLFLAGNGFAQPAKISAVTKVSGKELYKVTLGTDNDEVVIGDEKNPATFKNQITFKKWFNEKQGDYENSLSIIPPVDLILNATVTSSNGQVLIRNNKIGFYYNKDPTSDDNFKFGLILYERPQSNIFQFQLEGWKEFDFIKHEIWQNYEEVYLTKELSPFQTEGIHYKRLDGIFAGRAYRLPEMQGGYAVYHKEKKDHILGRTNYQTGKLGDIYRPKLLDADGKFLGWVDLSIVNGIYNLSIENIPQDVIDNAKLPLIFNDVYGYNTKGGSAFGSMQVEACTPGTNIVAGTMTTISVWIYNTTGGTRTISGAFYNNSSGAPNARQCAVATNTAINGYNNWVDVDIADTAVTAQVYWPAFCTDQQGEANLYSYYDGGTGSYDWSEDTVAGGLPATWSENSSGAYRISFYGTYTPSVGAAATGTVMMVN